MLSPISVHILYTFIIKHQMMNKISFSSIKFTTFAIYNEIDKILN